METQTALNLDQTLMELVSTIGFLVSTFGWSGVTLIFIFYCWKSGWKFPWTKGIVLGPNVSYGEFNTALQQLESRLLKKMEEISANLHSKMAQIAADQKENSEKHEKEDHQEFTKLWREVSRNRTKIGHVRGKLGMEE